MSPGHPPSSADRLADCLALHDMTGLTRRQAPLTPMIPKQHPGRRQSRACHATLARASPDDPSGEVDLRTALTVLLRGLPPGQRQVLWLREAARFSVAETAMILDLRPGTVKSQLNAAKKRLKELHRTSSGRWEAEFQ